MKKKWKLGMLLTLLFVFVMQMTVMAAGETVTMHYCYIEGDQVNVIVSGTAASDDGNYYLFALKTYEAGVGARTDYCAVAPAAETVHFTTPLGLDTAAGWDGSVPGQNLYGAVLSESLEWQRTPAPAGHPG